MNSEQIENLRNGLKAVFKETIHPTGNKKIIAEFVSMFNTVLDYTARLQGYKDYDDELCDVEKQTRDWDSLDAVFTPHS